MKWCCAVFEGCFAVAGTRGFAIFPTIRDREEPGPYFSSVPWIRERQLRYPKRLLALSRMSISIFVPRAV